MSPKLERIIENLVVNAAKHTPVGTTIWVRLDAQDDGGMLLVEDEGPGVPAQLREQIFQPFRQGRNIADHAPGSGIGLALSPSSPACMAAALWSRTAPAGAPPSGSSSPTARPQRLRAAELHHPRCPGEHANMRNSVGAA